MSRARTKTKVTAFVRVAANEWHLCLPIHGRRRRRLLYGPSFRSIVRRIARLGRVVNLKHAALRKARGYYRVDVTLALAARTVDLFHSSAAGYRAQYYRSVTIGEAANHYLIERLTPGILKYLQRVGLRSCPPWWVEKSLRGSEAKAWIHQGPWLRQARRSDRNLFVSRWLAHGARDPKRQLWATLTPRGETRIDLKGAPLTRDGKYLRRHLKPNRSKDIRDLGYT